jgi:hypothetical protein
MPKTVVVEGSDEGEVEGAAVGGALAAATLAGASSVKADQAQASADEAKIKAEEAKATADVAIAQPAGVTHEEVGAIVDDKLGAALDRLALAIAPPPEQEVGGPIPAPAPTDEPPKSVEKEQAHKKTWRERWEGSSK